MKSLLYPIALALLATNVMVPARSQSDAVAKLAAGTYELDASHSNVAARVSHLGFSDTTVYFPNVSGSLTWDPAKPAASTLEVTIDIASLNSGWGTRDNHLKSPEFFGVAEFPKATYKASALTKLSDTSARIDGNLMLHGVTKPVPLVVTFNKAGPDMMKASRVGFSAKATIKRSDFGIKTYLPAVGDDVSITIDAEFVKK